MSELSEENHYAQSGFARAIHARIIVGTTRLCEPPLNGKPPTLTLPRGGADRPLAAESIFLERAPFRSLLTPDS